MNLHKHQLYLYRGSFNIWWSIIRISTEGKSLIMISAGGLNVSGFCWPAEIHIKS